MKHTEPQSFLGKLYKYRTYLLGLVILVVGIASIVGVQAHQKNAAENATTSLAEAKGPTPHEITVQQKRLKHKLNRYLKSVTSDGTASVSFYNLGPTAGSSAAKSQTTRQFYKQGKLATSANAHTPMVSASTYKLFIAAYLFHQNHLGYYDWTLTEKEGFQRMIVNSENDFAEGVLDTYGLTTLDDFIASEGWYTPTFVANQASVTTAYSLTLLLKKLARQQAPFNHLHDQQWLLSLMRKQIYRTGIPAGAATAKKGTVAADKVGFLGDTNNDAAIVTLPNGQRYVLVIMTHGHGQSGFSGFPRMAEITTHIQKMMYDPSIVQGLNR
ncbi:serine hydrolase [Levilactobacillus enshiensis]|uniref:serine hydrolase n=1 Tax=Levilactobacillus enshiensis TaxID=2590213 RepID=UPI00117B4000|nr:serine hydrolase [Levilactobacillus enshiensis]